MVYIILKIVKCGGYAYKTSFLCRNEIYIFDYKIIKNIKSNKKFFFMNKKGRII